MDEPLILVLLDQFTPQGPNGMDGMDAIVDEHGWLLVADIPRGHAEPAAWQWEAPDGSRVAYIEDHIGDVRFFQITGPGREALGRELRRRLPYVDVEALLDDAETAEEPVTCIRALSRLVVCRPPKAERRWLDIWAKMLGHEHVAVRRAAIRTAYGCPWPELRAIVEARRGTETRLADQLEALLQSYMQAPMVSGGSR